MRLTVGAALSVLLLVCGTAAEHFSSYSTAHHPAYPSGSSADYYQPPRSQTVRDRISNFVYGFSDRQDDEGLLAATPFLALSLLAFAGLVVTFFLYGVVWVNSSGRGLDTDEWEVDHSVWMNQLQKDFEDSWSEE